MAKGIGNNQEITNETFATPESAHIITDNSTRQDSFQFLKLNHVKVEAALERIITRKSSYWDGISSKVRKIRAKQLSRLSTTL